MRFSLPLQWRFMAALAATSQLAPTVRATALLDALDEALLNDIIEAYTSHEPSTCTSAASESATSFSFDWPDTNAASNWYDVFEPFEQSLFQTIMTHNDTTGDRSWSIRIGTSGNMYSHFTPDMYGETLPPQKYDNSPWIDEVQQTVSVNGELNKNLAYPEYCPGPVTDDDAQCKRYYIHQAGAYQRDAPYTDVPFFSPSLAKHCSGNSCIFASWGTSAHVATPFTSPIIFINKYTNCDNGVIEHTQMIHNFADPSDPASTATNVDQTYFNVGWGGVRSSTLPFALEPDPSTGALSYEDVNNVDYLNLCKWGALTPGGHDAPLGPAGRAARTDLKDLGGYTTFVDDGLLVNLTLPPILPWCRNETDPTCADATTCMQATCTDTDIQNGLFTRIELKVAANSSPNCAYHVTWNGLVSLKCNMRDTGFGRSFPYLSSAEPCAPWTNVGFYNTLTGEGLDVAYVRHWSISPNNRLVYFAVFSTDRNEAISMVNSIFDNTGNSNELPIEIRPTSSNVNIPVGYDPSALSTFTYVYGKGEGYEGVALDGKSRRRIGSTEQGVTKRDYTVFTINWYGGARLQAGSTYANRGYMFSSDLGSVKTTADDLVNKTFVDEIGLELWSARTVDIYQSGTNFVVMTAASAQGTSTSCTSSSASLVCSGTSTPESGYVPFFYMSCGTSRYFGSDPYHFTPSFGASFPAHGSITNPVRSYLCDGQAMSIRPSWKLMGFFDTTDSGCASLATATYEETVCDADSSISPSKTPTSSPSASPTTQSPTTSPSSAPSSSPTTKSPTKIPTSGPSSSPTTQSPTKSPTDAPSSSPTTESPTKSPTDAPSSSPTTQSPTKSPTDAPSSSPTKTPTSQPSKSPESSPSKAPTNQPSNSPTDATSSSPSKTPTSHPSNIPTSIPSKVPTDNPTNFPTPPPTKFPTPPPENFPSHSPTTNPINIPTIQPTDFPSFLSIQPTDFPTYLTTQPTDFPSFLAIQPTDFPTYLTTQPTAPPVPAPCTGMSRIMVDVLTDNFPYETSWTLTNTCTGQIQESVGRNILYTTAATKYSNKYCVPPARYQFKISDSFGDGICCVYGDGSYEVTSDGVSVASGGQFTSATSSDFGSCGSTPPPTPAGIHVVATYDSSLGAPKCTAVGTSCASGKLLDGKANNKEPNPPNTLDSCTDGTSGRYHSDESIDKIIVSAVEGGQLQAGGVAEIEAKVWAWGNGNYDTADFYYAANANDPTWLFIGSRQPDGGGLRKLVVQYNLPDSAFQAVRVNFRFGGKQGGTPDGSGSCIGGTYDDIDDLVFSVATGGMVAASSAKLNPVSPIHPQKLDCQSLSKNKKRCAAASSTCRWVDGRHKGCYENIFS